MEGGGKVYQARKKRHGVVYEMALPPRWWVSGQFSTRGGLGHPYNSGSVRSSSGVAAKCLPPSLPIFASSHSALLPRPTYPRATSTCVPPLTAAVSAATRLSAVVAPQPAPHPSRPLAAVVARRFATLHAPCAPGGDSAAIGVVRGGEQDAHGWAGVHRDRSAGTRR